jgi:CheY-like chemotaxis protein
MQNPSKTNIEQFLDEVGDNTAVDFKKLQCYLISEFGDVELYVLAGKSPVNVALLTEHKDRYSHKYVVKYKDDEIGKLVFWRAIGSDKPNIEKLLKWRGVLKLIFLPFYNLYEAEMFSQELFITNISHELRTPLQGVVGYSQLLKQKFDVSYIDHINTCSMQLLKIINDVLDFSQLATGKFTIKTVTFTLNQLWKEILSASATMINTKNQKVELIRDFPLHQPLCSDQQKILQIMVNLISNASKFSPTWSVIRVTFSLAKSSLRVVVEDQGCGISTNDQLKLFNSYLQLKQHTHRTGTGLGLTISKKLIEAMGGKIWVDSVVGNGSKFCFVVQMDKHVHYNLSNLKIELRSSRILLIDDHVHNRVLFTKMLLDIDTVPIVCSNGTDALQYLTIQPFRVILVDICMDDMNGIELAQKIREIEPDSKILAISSMVGNLHDTIPALFNYILYKPFTAHQLYEAIAIVLKIYFKSTSPMEETTEETTEETKEETTKYSGYDSDLTPVSRPSTFSISCKNKQILVVDDNLCNLKLFVKMLNSVCGNDFDIVEANSAKKALGIIRNSDKVIEYIFLDLRMPEMDGFQFMQQIKLENLIQDTKIVVMTASISSEDRAICDKKFEVHKFFTKPVRLEEIPSIFE